KDQLRKMDETFEEVDFSYVSKTTGEHFPILTLEEIENEVKPSIPKSDVAENSQPKKSETIILSLEPGEKIIRDNQSGISYDNLFGAYLLNATDFNITDPYIRLPYQLRNFMELAKLISEKKDPDTEVKLHLITSNDEEF